MNPTEHSDFLAGQHFAADEGIAFLLEAAEEAEDPVAFMIGVAMVVMHTVSVNTNDAVLAAHIHRQSLTQVLERIARGEAKPACTH